MQFVSGPLNVDMLPAVLQPQLQEGQEATGMPWVSDTIG